MDKEPSTEPRLGPYRTPPQQETKRPAVLHWIIGGAALLAIVCLVGICRSGRARPGIDEIPKDLLASVEVYPAPAAELPMATPLAPLLASRHPDSLAVISPREGATRLSRGGSLEVRFNRPMVEGRVVGRELAEAPVRFEPPIPGTFTWRSRSALVFRPAPEAWAPAVTESRLLIAPDLTALDGEVLADEAERIVVLDGSPRVVPYRSSGRVNAGAPLPLYFDAPVEPRALASELLVYEVGGGQRSLPVAVSASGQPEGEGELYRVEVSPRKNLEPGARIALAVTPRFLRWGGSHPGVFEYELMPRPQIEGIDCHEAATSPDECTYTESPGSVIDIGSTLRLLSSAQLGEVAASEVRVSPALPGLRVSVVQEGPAARRLLAIDGEWEPDQVYEVRVGRLVTAAGEALRPAAPLAIRSAGHAPEVRVATGRLSYESDAPPRLRFSAVNTSKGQVLYKAVPQGRELEAALSSRDFLGAGETVTPLAPLAPTARPNRWGAGELRWRDDGGRTADMAVVGFWPSVEQHTSLISTSFVQSTDLGVSLRGSQRDLLVWVTSLSTGRPVRGARVTAVTDLAAPAGEARTDGDGVAVIHLQQNPLQTAHAVLVAAGDDRAVVVLDPRQAVAPYGMGLTPGEGALAADLPVASVFADRGAYRPGEKLRAKLVVRQVRDATATAVTTGSVTVRLFSPSDTAPVGEAEVALNRWGSGRVEFDLPATASLGQYTLDVFRGPDSPSIGSATIQVAQFRQPTFRVDLAEAAAGGFEALHEGDTLAFSVAGTYLFGAPVSQGDVSWSVVRDGIASYPERWSEYEFTAADAVTPGATLASGEGALDAGGQAGVTAQVGLGSAVRARLLIEAEVTDSAGHTYGARRSVVAYPATYEAGVREGDDWVALGQELDLEAIVIDHAGDLVEGRAVAARFVREGWHSWWEWSSGAGGEEEAPADDEGFRLRRDRQAEEAHRCDLASAATPVHCAFAPTRPGTYLLEVTTRDDQGRTSVASRRVYVAGPDEHPDRDPPGAPLTVTPTRRAWSVGEEAELAFESPWPRAQALITVEREGVIHTERREIAEAGGQVIRLPLTDAMVPNVFVGVTLVRPRTGQPDAEVDLNAPDLRFGIAELRVQPATTQLRVAIEMPAGEARSGTDVPVTVRVTDARGRPVRAELALWAVDEGSLRLTSYEVPNPTSGIFRERAAAFAWEDIRRQLVSRVEPPPVPLAGGGGTDGDGQAADLLPEGEAFDPTPLWEPHLETDADGRARAVLHLPERETEYRVMAVVLDTGARWGTASSHLTASQPLVLRAALPRFLRAGDRFEATLFVHNTTDAPLRATVVATVGGERRATRTIEVAPDGEVRVAEPATAPDEGPFELRFEATAGDFTTRAERSLTVLPAGRWVRTQAVGAIEPGRAVRLEVPSAALPTGGRVDLIVASHPFLGFDGAVQALEDSYWDGSETLSATLLAMASYAELGVGARPGGLTTAELHARAAQVVRRLLSFQNFEAGFGRWSSSASSRPRETALAVHALQRAKRAGFDVPEAPLTRAREHLVQLAGSEYFGDTYGLTALDELAFAQRVLAEGDAAQSERIDALYEQRERLSPFGLAQLALALGEGDARTDTLVTEAATLVLTDRDDEAADPHRIRWIDDSSRIYGAVLEAASIVEVGRRHTRPLATKVLEMRGADPSVYPWSTPTETAHALAALSAYARLFELPEAARPTVRLGEAEIEPAGHSRDAAWYRLPFAQLRREARELRIQSSDRRPVFFAIDGRWAVPLGEPDQTARGRLVAVHRVYETPEGAPIADGAVIPLGAMVRVRLFVYTESWPPPLVALHDQVCAGFEAVDSTLDTTPRQSLDALFGTGPDDEAVDPRAAIAMRSVYDISHRSFDTAGTTYYFDRLESGLREFTYAVRATTVGEFVVPPAQIDAMYDPRFTGRSTAARLRVVARASGGEAR